MARLSKDQWQRLLNLYHQSELTQVEFAERHALNVGTFRSHLYRERHSSDRSNQLSTFVELEIQQTQSPQQFTLCFGSVKFSFSEYPDPRWLAQLVREIEVS